jgi:hypothetical protein
MSEQEAKICPFLLIADFLNAKCRQKKCAWFIDGQCATVVVARFIISLDRELETLV